jgi:phytoene dehydrogenase-like protein
MTMTTPSLFLFRVAAFSVLLAGINGFSVSQHPRSSFGLLIDIKSMEQTVSHQSPRLQTTQLHGVRSFFRNPFSGSKNEEDAGKEQEGKEVSKKPLAVSSTAPPDLSTKASPRSSRKPTESVSLCIVGGGVSGLTAAITASKAKGKSEDAKVVLLEATGTLGGRVQSDKTKDGYVLDRGFAVFIEEYPFSKELLDYEALKLGKFLPGALVKVKGRNRLAKVADPLRQPETLVDAVLAPIGSLFDKISLLPLIFTVRTKTVKELFEEAETDTFTALTDKWGMSDVILDRFFRPFLEGIYLAPLEEQSSRMFSFIFKMFSEGAATLPEGGMGAIAQQLVEKANATGTDIRVGQIVSKISQNDNGYLLETLDGKTIIQAKSVIVATDCNVAQKIISQLEGFQSLETLPPPPQREVGCLYYSFDSETPVKEPILILNGAERGTENSPVNNVCFPSAVAKGYAPEGCGLCSVTVLKGAMDTFKGREDELDQAVRKQLATWFPEQKEDILNTWELQRIYNIPNAQPFQFKGPFPANVDGGRVCTTYRGKDLPPGVYVCGDHMATATLNGALESGVNAGMAAASALK